MFCHSLQIDAAKLRKIIHIYKENDYFLRKYLRMSFFCCTFAAAKAQRQKARSFSISN